MNAYQLFYQWVYNSLLIPLYYRYHNRTSAHVAFAAFSIIVNCSVLFTLKIQ